MTAARTKMGGCEQLMMFPALTLTSKEAAQLLGVPLNTFYKNARDLRAQGFPQKLRSLGGRYDRQAIEAWLARQRTPSAPPAADDIPAWQAELDRRAGAGL